MWLRMLVRCGKIKSSKKTYRLLKGKIMIKRAAYSDKFLILFIGILITGSEIYNIVKKSIQFHRFYIDNIMLIQLFVGVIFLLGGILLTRYYYKNKEEIDAYIGYYKRDPYEEKNKTTEGLTEMSRKHKR